MSYYEAKTIVNLDYAHMIKVLAYGNTG